jgi:hypothetical protein
MTFSRYLPTGNSPDEIRLVVGKLYDCLNDLQGGTATTQRSHFSNGVTGGGGGSASVPPHIPMPVPAPQWVFRVSTPFLVIQSDPYGNVITDAQGYGLLQIIQ